MSRSRLVQVFVGILAVSAGCLFQFNCAGSLAQVNPCATILSPTFCNPVVYAQLFGDAFQSDFDADPTCVVPFACNAGTP